MEVGTRHCGKPEGRQVTAGRGGGSGGGSTNGFGPPTPPGILAPDKGVVPGCGRPCSAARSDYPRADHDGAGGSVQLRPTPGGEYPHFSEAVTGGQLGTYRERYQVGGETITQSLLWGNVRDAGRAPERVDGGGEEGDEGRGGNRGGDDGGKGVYVVYGDYGGVQLGEGG